MSAKVFFAVGLGVGVSLLVQASYESHNEARALKNETRTWAERTAQLFVGAVEHSMLRGDGIAVQASIEDLERKVDSVDVRIYDHRGIEVFASKEPPPPREQLPAPVARLLERPDRRIQEGMIAFRPLANERRCHECHDQQSALRGVLQIAFSERDWVTRRERVLARIVADGFTQIMSARQSELLDDYFAEVARTTSGIDAVAVFDPDGSLVFGQPPAGLNQDQLTPSLQRGAQLRYVEGSAELPMRTSMVALVPLPMQQRCVACHDDEIGVIRGVLAVALEGERVAPASAMAELEGVIENSLRFIMLSQLGRRIADFLDDVATTEAVDELVLYDQEGRLYWTTRHPEPPPQVAEVLASGQSLHRYQGKGLNEHLQTIAPLVNKPGCMSCHGSGTSLRGAVSVTVSTAMAEEARQANLERRRWYTGFNLLGILIMLAALLQYLVARPVHRIGEVAEQVGKGNLNVIVERADPEGDEIARLGNRVNEMVHELRTKMQLLKFVSKGTAEAAADAGVEGLTRTGERRSVTVLFSDIRGFTAFSERFEPEVVVEMLNRLLRAQAEVVREFGGDIDKYVGDELMAVFTGEDASARALSCAVGMLEAVHDARRAGETLSVGIGISAGDVIYGAIGHEERMDFTVIGDVVNIGARLCSAAAEDEILLSAAVHDAIGEQDELDIEPGEPLVLKGKREPLPVFKMHI